MITVVLAEGVEECFSEYQSALPTDKCCEMIDKLEKLSNKCIEVIDIIVLLNDKMPPNLGMNKILLGCFNVIIKDLALV